MELRFLTKIELIISISKFVTICKFRVYSIDKIE